MTAQEAASNVNKALNSSLEKLSSGLRINKASDDASGMAIADKLRTQASALGQSISNANSGNALVQIADKAMSEQSNILDIVKQKLIQAGTSTTSTEGREAIRKDINKLLQQFDNIASQTNYNGINLLDTKGKSFTFQVGEDKSYDISVSTAYASNTAGLGGGSVSYTAADLEALTTTGATSSVKVGTAGEYIAIDGSRNTAATAASDATIEISANNVTELTFRASTAASATITIKTTDAATIDILNSMDNGSTELAKLNNGEYTLTTATGSASLNFGSSGIDLSKIEVSGLGMGTASGQGEALYIKTKDAVSIKRTDQNVDTTASSKDLLINSFTATATVGGTTAIQTDMTGGKLLSSLKNLTENGLTSEIANEYMGAVDVALSQVNTVRSDFGSTQNQLDSFIRNAMTTQTNIKAAESVIRDVDYAAESANFNKQNIIAQAGTFALSQANQVQQNVLKLLQ